MKKTIILALMCAMAFTGVTTNAAQAITIKVNGTVLENANPYMDNGTTMLPLRVIGESLKAKIDYDTYKGVPQIMIFKGDKRVIIIDDLISKNGDISRLSKPITIKNGITYAALRDIAEALDASVDFNQPTNTVSLVENRLSAEEIEEKKAIIKKDFEIFSKDYIVKSINKNFIGFENVTSEADKNVLISYVEQLELEKQEEQTKKEEEEKVKLEKEAKELEKLEKEREREEQAKRNKIEEAKKKVYIGDWEFWVHDDGKDVYRYQIVNESNMVLKKVKVTAGSGYSKEIYVLIDPYDRDSFYLRGGNPVELKVEALEFE